MAKDFKKLSCYAEKIIIKKVDDELLTIHVTDKLGDEHNFKIGVAIDNFQNIDTFGNKKGHMIDIPVLDLKYSVNKTNKLDSKNVSMKWNHTKKPSVFEIKNKDKIVFSGTYCDAMKWAKNNIAECVQRKEKK